MGRKNVQGGNKTKGMARNRNSDNDHLITITSEEQEYAIVTSVSGNGRFRVSTPDKKIYIAILPGSMRGSKKRNFYVALHSIILINNRSSFQTLKHLAHVDIIHVYSQNHIDSIGLSSLFSNNHNIPTDFDFQNDNLSHIQHLSLPHIDSSLNIDII